MNRRKKKTDISFDEILLDSSNLPSFDISRMEGKMERPISGISILAIGGVFGLIVLVFLYRLFSLQVLEGEAYAAQSAENVLQSTLIVAERGVVRGRTGELLAWNELDHSGQYEFPVRAYTDRNGLGQLLGYVSYPQKDSSGVYYRTEYVGRSGVEEAYEEVLGGENGRQLVEVTAQGEVLSEHTVDDPVPGQELQLSVDAELSEQMYTTIADITKELGFRSGGAAMMDIETGEIIAITSFPSYDPEVLSDGDDVEAIEALNEDERFPFLNKIIGGAYVPGSIVKPFVAYGALAEDVISETTRIVSNGELVVPNPYNPSNPTIFADWRVQGEMTVRTALAFSSNVFFYIVGGGFEDQEGLGISRLKEYFNLFGLGEKTGVSLLGEVAGTVPDPEWKQRVFDDDWRVGDTYLTSIGQFGFQVTPIQMLRAYAAIANGGYLVTPHVELGEKGARKNLLLDLDALEIVREGMRQTVVHERGTALALQRDDVAIAAKTGTAELGVSKSRVNSWVAGYFPYKEPKYAFILFMEDGPRENMLGASRVMGWVFDWLAEHRSEMFES